MNLTLITPCSRPKNLKSVAESIDFSKIKQWIISYDTSKVTNQEKQFLDNPKVLELFEDPAEHNLKSVMGNFQRFFALSKVDKGYVYLLDDDSCLLPDFLPTIESYITTPDKWYTFDVQYGSGRVLKGDFSTQQDTGSICFDVSVTKKYGIYWGGINHQHMTEKGNDGNFIGQFHRKAITHHEYIPKILFSHNELVRVKQG